MEGSDRSPLRNGVVPPLNVISHQVRRKSCTAYAKLSTLNMGNRLATTQWSQVLAARDGSDTEARRALEGLCQTYWSPLYAYARSLGHDADDAQDLTQGFFAHLLEKEILQRVEPSKGRFRSFLLASLKNFIAHQHRKESTLKRGWRYHNDRARYR